MDQDTDNFCHGAEIPIPIFPEESVVFVPLIFVQKRRFQILSVLLLVGVGASISNPSTILFDPVVIDSHALYPRAILLFPLELFINAQYPRAVLFDHARF